MYYYLNLFFVCCFYGFIFEQGFMCLFNQPYNSGILTGPWTIIYGIASLIILKIGSILDNVKNKFLRYILFFLINFLILIIIEYLGGLILEKLLGIVYWDYSDMSLSFNKYVNFYICLIWGILAFIYYYLLYPWLKKIPKFITIILIFFFCFDIIYTIYNYLKYPKQIPKQILK